MVLVIYISILIDLLQKKDYKYYYIDHYYSKSTEEFINKINKGDAMFESKSYTLHKIWKYFSQSRYTEEKRLMIENRTGLNLTYYMNFSLQWLK